MTKWLKFLPVGHPNCLRHCVILQGVGCKAHVVFSQNFPTTGQECRYSGDILVIGDIPSSHPSQCRGPWLAINVWTSKTPASHIGRGEAYVVLYIKKFKHCGQTLYLHSTYVTFYVTIQIFRVFPHFPYTSKASLPCVGVVWDLVSVITAL